MRRNMNKLQIVLLVSIIYACQLKCEENAVVVGMADAADMGYEGKKKQTSITYNQNTGKNENGD